MTFINKPKFSVTTYQFVNIHYNSSWACMTGFISNIKRTSVTLCGAMSDMWGGMSCFMFKINPCLFHLTGWRLWRVKVAQRPLFETRLLASAYPGWSRWCPYVCSTWPGARDEQEEHTRCAAVSHWPHETRAKCHSTTLIINYSTPSLTVLKKKFQIFVYLYGY